MIVGEIDHLLDQGLGEVRPVGDVDGVLPQRPLQLAILVRHALPAVARRVHHPAGALQVVERRLEVAGAVLLDDHAARREDGRRRAVVHHAVPERELRVPVLAAPAARRPERAARLGARARGGGAGQVHGHQRQLPRVVRRRAPVVRPERRLAEVLGQRRQTQPAEVVRLVALGPLARRRHQVAVVVVVPLLVLADSGGGGEAGCWCRAGTEEEHHGERGGQERHGHRSSCHCIASSLDQLVSAADLFVGLAKLWEAVAVATTSK